MYEKLMQLLAVYGSKLIIEKVGGAVSGLLKSTLFKRLEGKTCIIIPSLYVPPVEIDGRLIPLVIKLNEGGKPSPVHAPQPVTGIRDSIGLSLLVTTLKESGIDDLKILHDPIHPSDKSNNLVLIGSPTSNLVGKDLYKKLPKKHFRFTRHFDQIILKDVAYGSAQEGMYGIVLKCQNYWNKERNILWFAGIGPTGTETSIRAAIEDFKCVRDKDIKKKLMKERVWVIVVKGRLSNGYVTDIEYLDHSFEL